MDARYGLNSDNVEEITEFLATSSIEVRFVESCNLFHSFKSFFDY